MTGRSYRDPSTSTDSAVGVGPLKRRMGALSRAMFGSYSASKAAANAITVAFAADLEAAGIKVNAACPGFTSTDLNFFRGTRTVEQGAHEPVRLALIGDDGPTGTFSNEDGPLPGESSATRAWVLEVQT